MTKSSILVDLDDPRTAKIADVISNKTSKKILSLLKDKEMSESDIASQLNMPLNTIEYNIKKLESVGLIEKISGFLWSEKGKRIHKYKVSNKKIIISPKSLTKGIIPAILGSTLITLIIKIIADRQIPLLSKAQDSTIVIESSKVAQDTLVTASSSAATSNVAAWFFLGALTTILIFILWSWKENSSERR